MEVKDQEKAQPQQSEPDRAPWQPMELNYVGHINDIAMPGILKQSGTGDPSPGKKGQG